MGNSSHRGSDIGIFDIFLAVLLALQVSKCSECGPQRVVVEAVEVSTQ